MTTPLVPNIRTTFTIAIRIRHIMHARRPQMQSRSIDSSSSRPPRCINRHTPHRHRRPSTTSAIAIGAS